MDNNKRDNRDDLSVDELVNKLKDNINSGASEIVSTTEDAPTPPKKKGDDPNRDIASMLKMFLPDEKEQDDFELEEILEDNDEFELETETTADEPIAESGTGEFEFEDSEADLGISPISDSSFDEPAVDDDFSLDEDSLIFTTAEFVEEEKPKAKKKKGLFGQKSLGKNLADGYVEMLENEIDEIGDISLTETDEDMSYEGEQLTLDDVESVSDTDEFVAEDLNSQKEESAVEEAAVAQMYIFDDGEGAHVEEEEYFVAEKNPLAFDNDDETPVAPDAEAFNSVSASDSEGIEADVSDTVPELDDKDINLMVALGYEDELEKAIGKKKVEEISENLTSEIVDFIDVDNAYAFDGIEITDAEQFRTVGNKYKHEHQTMKLRLVGTAIFTAALLLFELLGAFGITLGGALNIHHYPVVGIMLSLQLLVLACALSWRQLLDGLLGAITFNPSPASIPSVAVIMTVLYDIIMALISPNSGLYLYNFPAALSLMFLVLNDFFNFEREIRAFNTVATKKPKYVLSSRKTEYSSEKDRLEEVLSDDKNEVYEEKVLEVLKADFVENYFRRSNIVSPKKRIYNYTIYPFIALAIILGIVSYITNKNGVVAFNVSILSVLFGIPMSALFIGSYPFFSAVKLAFEDETTIIGEESILEYSDATSVVFRDIDVFPSELTVTRGLQLYDNNAIYDVLYNLTGLYSKLGGPLKERLEQATVEMGHSENVSVTRVEEKGVEAIVDGKTTILAGKAEFMEQNGISVVADSNDEAMFNEGCSCIYVALDGVLSAKLYVQYNANPEFNSIINDLARDRTEVVVKTYDPNIDSELLMSRLLTADFSARIVRGTNPDEDSSSVERVESGIVSRGSLYALAHALTMCNSIRRVRKSAKTVSIVSMLVSIGLVTFLSLFSSNLHVTSIYVALYQIFWLLPIIMFTKLNVK